MASRGGRGHITFDVSVNLAENEYVTGYSAQPVCEGSYENDRIWVVTDASLLNRNTMRFNLYRGSSGGSGGMMFFIVINKFV